MAFRSIQRFFKEAADKNFSAGCWAALAVFRAGAAVSDSEQAPAATRAFEVVQFDGHKIDLRLTVKMIDPHGFERLLEINRIWILVLLDVFTRAVVGYVLTLSKEYNKDDVATAMQAALVPFKPREYKIPAACQSEAEVAFLPPLCPEPITLAGIGSPSMAPRRIWRPTRW